MRCRDKGESQGADRDAGLAALARARWGMRLMMVSVTGTMYPDAAGHPSSINRLMQSHRYPTNPTFTHAWPPLTASEPSNCLCSLGSFAWTKHCWQCARRRRQAQWAIRPVITHSLAGRQDLCVPRHSAAPAPKLHH